MNHPLPTSTFEDGYALPSTLDSLLVESIDEVLTDLLGRKTREAIYDYIERNYSFNRENLPKNLHKFFELLDQTFGKGSKTIGNAIIKKLFKKLKWEFAKIPGFEFFDYLEAARARIARELIEQAKSDTKEYDSLLSERKSQSVS